MHVGVGLSTTLAGNVLGNDTDASPLRLASVQFSTAASVSVPGFTAVQVAGAHGLLTFKADGNYSYQPTSSGQDVFTETVRDAAGNTSQTAL